LCFYMQPTQGQRVFVCISLVTKSTVKSVSVKRHQRAKSDFAFQRVCQEARYAGVFFLSFLVITCKYLETPLRHTPPQPSSQRDPTIEPRRNFFIFYYLSHRLACHLYLNARCIIPFPHTHPVRPSHGFRVSGFVSVPYSRWWWGLGGVSGARLRCIYLYPSQRT
jgi:hypothetical protein